MPLHDGFHPRFTATSTLPYHARINAHIRDFGSELEPRYIIRAGSLDQ
jgi:hypothetical protein